MLENKKFPSLSDRLQRAEYSNSTVDLTAYSPNRRVTDQTVQLQSNHFIRGSARFTL